ncbi:NGG1p interacting factor 3 [Coniochaeta ligniaria NRRL 30616]|uniref:NGG1p interacting factor 3 n=1 Tax=Coniochaeta ligniaria NRRL 30616 TaxID=1408157 RepID=A0A1J7IHJ5_9PEZI|nr:NGG1p interacting factor 3 [Coniochaeta ligniaria NRRL 30616]
MAASAPQLHPFTTQVVDAMRSLYPEELADRSWDNVGLLLENIKSGTGNPTVLVTNDLTISVAEEAIRRKATVIVSYHPFLFRPIKSISVGDPHQRIILQLVQNNIAVYSPHTAVDAAPGGMADWLADMLPGSGASSRRKIVTPLPVSQTVPANSGYGRVVYLDQPVGLEQVIKAYAEGLGGQRYLMIARPKHMTQIKSAAVCPGSGFDVLKDCDADLIVTGEMTHHNALKAVMQGKCVIAAFHSNSERTFLRDRLQPTLEKLLREKVPEAEVLLSETDEDPFEIVDVQNLKLRD